MLVSSFLRVDGKGQNDHFRRKDWGEFQNNRVIMIADLKALEQQKRPLLPLFGWPARNAAVSEVAMLWAV